MLVVPVGGGGLLLAGAITYLREHAPSTRIVGVEPAGAASMAAAVAAGEPVDRARWTPSSTAPPCARSARPTFDVVRDAGVELLAVPEGRICVEMLALYQSRRHHRRARRGAVPPAALDRLGIPRDATTVLPDLGRQQRRLALRRHRRARPGLRGTQALLPRRVPAGAGRAAPLPLDDVLGPDDDVTLFEYTKRSNRETGPALVGIELGSPDDLPALLKRMQEAPPHIEPIPPDSPLFGFIL